jgi:hypothetical protein
VKHLKDVDRWSLVAAIVILGGLDIALLGFWIRWIYL